jgi:hypothetical protein
MVEDAGRLLATVGLALLTVNPTQLLVAGLLFPSPLYTAFQENGPAEFGNAGAEDGTMPPDTVTDGMAVVIPEQVLPVKRVYVTVPPAEP